MKSTIRIDFRGVDVPNQTEKSTSAFEPVIRVNLEDSQDVRDGLLKSFFESLGGQSNWLSVDYHSDRIDGAEQPKRITIHPVKPTELEETKHIIDNRLGLSGGHEDPYLNTLRKIEGIYYAYTKINNVDKLMLITGTDEIWFEMSNLSSCKINREYLNTLSDLDLTDAILALIGEVHKSNSLPSRFQIGDKMDFTTPKAKQHAFNKAKELPENKGKSADDIEYLPEYFWGEIVAVKFTKAKVWYDILDDYSGKVFESIPSDDVKFLADEFSSKPK